MSNFPETSIEAYDQVSPEALRDIYDKIVGALKELGKANYETIANHLHFSDRNMVSRRLKEMIDNFNPPLICRLSSKSLTSRKRNAYDYSVFSPDTVVPPLEKITKGQPSAADYASKIIATSETQQKEKQSRINNYKPLELF